jgi:hypothetical protein
LLVDRIYADRCAHLSRVIDHESRDVARTGRQIEHAHCRSRQNPAPQKMFDQHITAEIAIELP